MKIMTSTEEQIKNIKGIASRFKDKITEEHAFVYYSAQLINFFSSKLSEDQYGEMRDSYFTDGSRDGGLDYIQYDDSTDTLNIFQCKYSGTVTKTSAVAEIRKAFKTIIDLDNSESSNYSSRVRKVFSSEISNFSSDEFPTINFSFISLNSFNYSKAGLELENDIQKLNSDQHIEITLAFYNQKKLETMLEDTYSKQSRVPEANLVISRKSQHRYLSYEGGEDKLQGYFVNISSKSLIQIYDRFSNNGLFTMNLRDYFKSKKVDNAIIKTLLKDPDRFWFLNNGITIACTSCYFDGTHITLRDFSIVNGGQTTNLIGQNSKSITKEFFIPAKIVVTNEDNSSEENQHMFNQIAQATNSQKPIRAQDLRSNDPALIALRKKIFNSEYGKQFKIDMSIKRGEDRFPHAKIKINNDVVAQAIFSFIYQHPGTARSNKNSLFSSDKNFDKIFISPHYTKSGNSNRLKFIIDLIRFWNDFIDILNLMANSNDSEEITREILRNGKLAIFATLGTFYRVVNQDYSEKEIIQIFDNDQNEDSELYDSFSYGRFYDKDTNDNLEKDLKKLIGAIANTILQQYQEQTHPTNLTNFLKLDKNYQRAAIRLLNSHSFSDEMENLFIKSLYFLKR